MNMVPVSEKELMDVDGGFIFTAAGLAMGAKLGVGLAKTYGIKKSVSAGASMATMGATGSAADVGVARTISRRTRRR
ncbi:MAG: hypothetical protein ACLFNQ_12810 [Spirochaetaceae bacterium]